MKGFRTFLSYYSIIVVTFLSIGTTFFYRNPQGIATIILIAPITFYFWLRISDPGHLDSPQWSARIVVIIFIFSLLGIYSLTLLRVFPAPEAPAKIADAQLPQAGGLEDNKGEYAELSEKLDNISLEIADLRTQLAVGEGLSLGIDTESIEGLGTVGFVTIKNSNLRSLDVFESALVNSAVVGSIDYGVDYQFYESLDGWYLLRLPDKTTGWVQAEFVEKVE